MKNRSWIIIFSWVTIVTVVIWALSPFILAWVSFPIPAVNWTSRGNFGDSFGALNTLFSGVGLAALIATLMLQARGIELQANELLDSQKEQRRIALSQIAAAKLQGLSSLLLDANDFIEKMQDVMEASKLNDRMLDRRHQELDLWFEKRRLLLKRISQLVRELDEGNELLSKMALAETQIAGLSGGNRPLGKDSDE